MFAALSIGRFLIIKGPPNLKLASFRFGISLGSLLPLCSLGGGGGGAVAAWRWRWWWQGRGRVAAAGRRWRALAQPLGGALSRFLAAFHNRKISLWKLSKETLIDGAMVWNKDNFNTLPEVWAVATQVSRVVALSFFLTAFNCAILSLCCWARAAFGRGLSAVMFKATSPSGRTSIVRTTWKTSEWAIFFSTSLCWRTSLISSCFAWPSWACIVVSLYNEQVNFAWDSGHAYGFLGSSVQNSVEEMYTPFRPVLLLDLFFDLSTDEFQAVGKRLDTRFVDLGLGVRFHLARVTVDSGPDLDGWQHGLQRILHANNPCLVQKRFFWPC